MQGLVEATAGRIVAIDAGKTLRHSFDRAADKSALHMISATGRWRTASRSASWAVDGKGEQRDYRGARTAQRCWNWKGRSSLTTRWAARRKLLKPFAKRAPITSWPSRITSRGCTKTWWPRSWRPLKANAARRINSRVTHDQGHAGCQERREYVVVRDLSKIRDRDLWPGPAGGAGPGLFLSGPSMARRPRRRGTTSAVAAARVKRAWPGRFCGHWGNRKQLALVARCDLWRRCPLLVQGPWPPKTWPRGYVRGCTLGAWLNKSESRRAASAASASAPAGIMPTSKSC